MRRLPLLIAAVVAIVLASLVHGTPEPTPATAAPAGRAGFSPGGSFLFADAASQSREVSTMKAAGARWIRLDVDWSAIETSRGSYDWTRTDQAVRSAVTGGLQVIGLIGYTPSWARPSGTSNRRPPTNPADMAAFATVMAKRYGPYVNVWEVWNEPNLASAWNPSPDPYQYVKLLKPVAASLRAADPGSTILSGGISSDGDDGAPGHYATSAWIYALYQSGAQSSFDGISFHPYSFPTLPSRTGSTGFAAVPTLRNYMVSRGDSAKGIWITEFGSPTLPAPGVVTNEQQAAILADAFRLVAQWPYVRTFLVYNLRDGLPTSSREQHFGLRTLSDQPKPAWTTFTTNAPTL
ncbi:cellulase family glycosylhydrolase [Actinomycetospora sp. OC33-EN08]|uniref:Cellulase family glycosylhydrolase n=1 Tax=Actinomycetospora aurantiaca TaxID=3129233 RepID=A0ABU8MHR9_9PSEU